MDVSSSSAPIQRKMPYEILLTLYSQSSILSNKTHLTFSASDAVFRNIEVSAIGGRNFKFK
jgi:hypothetical protein